MCTGERTASKLKKLLQRFPQSRRCGSKRQGIYNLHSWRVLVTILWFPTQESVDISASNAQQTYETKGSSWVVDIIDAKLWIATAPTGYVDEYSGEIGEDIVSNEVTCEVL